MTALEDWISHFPDGLTVAEYEALPEGVCRRIEIVDGAVLVSPKPLRIHQRIGRRLANNLENAGHPDFAAETDVDLRIRDVPLLIRQPDVVVYDAALPGDAVLRPEHCLLVVEVMSPGSITTDQIDKPAEYAAAGIEHFWRLELVDTSPVLYRYRLDPNTTTRTYGLVGKETGQVAVSEPLSLTVDLDALS